MPPNSTYWIEQCQRLAEKLSALTDGSAKFFVNGLYQQYTVSQDQDVINGAIAQTSHFLMWIWHYQDKILQLASVGPEFELANTIEKDVSKINLWLEELLCSVMGDFDEAVATYKLCGFMFQLK
ncbi:hypothetical protein L208DRAFT_1267346 [Tricholoma matsutake]|nr:hypothetical protein L208DRAFT_1267346 [Tricholoma matsutake 945]